MNEGETVKVSGKAASLSIRFVTSDLSDFLSVDFPDALIEIADGLRQVASGSKKLSILGNRVKISEPERDPQAVDEAA